MGDEQDAFDLPTRAQSGNVDIGHLSQNVESEESRLRGEQSGLLTNALNEYYNENTGFNGLSDSLRNAGYSDNRIADIRAGANAERVYRLHHTDDQGNPAPSGLALNQLQFLQSYSRTGLDIGRATIHTEDDGRTYVDDFRPTEEDGRAPVRPNKLYLPTPATFDPLTREQTAQIQLDRTYLSHITLQEPSEDEGLLQDDTNLETRHAVSQLVAQYYSQTSMPGNDQRRLKLYSDIQQLPGLQNQRDIKPKLLQLFNDIAVEEQYRIDNDGRPQRLTDTEWEQLQNNPNFYGQPILTTDTQPPISYIVSGQNYIEIDDSVDAPRTQRDFSLQNQQDINMFSTEFLTDRNSNDDTNILTQNILSTINYDPQDPNDLRLRLKVEDLVNRLNQERIFRSENFGRPSELTQLQYDFMLNHALQRDEPRYTGEDITTHIQPDGSTAFGFHSWDRINAPELLIIPTDNDIAEMINSGVYIVPGDEQRPDINPDDNLQPPPRRPNQPPIDPEIPIPDPQFTLPPDTPIIPTITGAGIPRETLPPRRPGLIPEAPPGFNPPIVPGQTQPINLRTGENLEVDTPQGNILRYQQFFNDNQNLYYGFREMFRDVIPVLSAGAGGYITYLYEASKQKGTLQTIINQETQLLNAIEGQLDSNLDSFEKKLEYFKRRQDLADRTGRDIERFLSKDIRNKELLISNKLYDLQRIKFTIEKQRETIEKLQKEILETDIHTLEIRKNIEELQNTNYEILVDLKESAPKILMGMNVGYTLGLMLSGYLYPTYMNINEPYLTANNIEYTESNTNQQKIQNLEDNTITKKDTEIEPTIKREYDAPPSKIIKPYEESFKPVKHGKRPLNYKEIQELKSTLNKSELNNLKNKFLYFDDGKLMLEKTNDKCKNVIQETQIPKRKVF